MRRREFIRLFSSTVVAWPLTARAQQPAMPVVGFLRPSRADEAGHLFAAVRQGLRESGYPSDKITIEARWADDRRSACRILSLNWSTFKYRRLLAVLTPRLRQRKQRQTFRSFSSPEAIQKRSGLCPTSVDRVAMLLA